MSRGRQLAIGAALAVTALLASRAATAAAEPLEDSACFSCHGDPAAGRFIHPEKFSASIHGHNHCTSCHADIAAVPHDVPVKPVNCSQCHQLEAEVYRQSDHGLAVHRGVQEAASCRDCHGNPHELVNVRDPASPVERANIPATCARCHSQTKEMAKFHLNQAAPIATYEESVHGLALKQGVPTAAVCTDCHGSHDLHKATNDASKLFWQQIPQTCGKCHENIKNTYARSVHGTAVGAGKREAPVCTDCHGEHTIAAVKQATSKVYPSHIPETCGQCHATERIVTKYQLPSHVVDTYMDSFHGLALQLGSLRAANCASCHGAHDILPSGDERSSVNPKNLAKTCGVCHPGVGGLVAKGQIHSGTQPGLEHRAVSVVRNIYFWLILLTIGGMFLHNLLDFARKCSRHYQMKKAAGGRLRMTLNERIQHGVLLAAFATLAYTGFALKFPQAWWATPFVGRIDWRSLGHRAAALIFVALALYHLWFMCATARGRKELKALWPRWRDAIDLLLMMGFYLGLRQDRPAVGRYSYVEKAEYWALVWGSIIMTLTGAFLTWQDWTLRVLPKWFFDVMTAIHYYEAILACLAIVIWHMYFVMFDPDEYPMKWTWVTGQSSEADQRHRKPDDEPPN
ncbi:MAG: cytochrome b/b6 domain-containing protein [Candidatus Omnitrophica bacterium]|nr:cytochrome b/b6 domain-containing protein [Candidatus Omnitrophota bacterium]